MAEIYNQQYYQDKYTGFMNFAREEFGKLNSSILGLVVPISEVCFRTTTEEEYSLHKKSLENLSRIKTTAEINNREITVFGLLNLLTDKAGDTRTIELAGPHPKYIQSGIQHIKLLSQAGEMREIFELEDIDPEIIGEWNEGETLDLAQGKQIRITRENLILKSLGEPGTVVELLY